MNFLLRSAVSQYLGHFPEGLVEFHILIDALDCAGKRCFYRDSSQERPRAGLGSFPRSGDAQPEQTGQRVSGSRAVLQFECPALVRVREPNHFSASR
jgi:hypothetical protein